MSTWPGSPREEGVLFIGRAQEKTRLFRTERRRDADGDSYPWIVKTTAMVNHFYFYAVDADFGPFFLKFCSYFPYNAKLCLNGHEYAKRQAAQAGIAFTALDNGFATCADPAAVQAICDRLGPEQIDALLRKWLASLPHPFTAADRAAGYRYDISVLQAEFSLTQVLDRPLSGRIFFEQVIRDNLDIGRPDQVALIFDRRLKRTGPRHPGPVPHPGDHRGRDPEPAHRLQAHPDQAVPQGRTRPADRDHDQRHPRLRDRQTADQPARAAGDRLLRQPTPAGRPTTQPQPDPRRRGVHRRSPTRSSPTPGSASPGCAWATAAPTRCCGAAGLPAAIPRVRQPRPTRAARRLLGTAPRRDHRRAGRPTTCAGSASTG